MAERVAELQTEQQTQLVATQETELKDAEQEAELAGTLETETELITEIMAAT